MSHCLWNDEENVHRYHLASWKHVTMSKNYGGLGVPDLRELNMCLLGSWISRYSKDKDKIWRQLVDFKYRTSHPNILCCKDIGASNFWKGVMGEAQVVKIGYRWKVGDGTKVRFWEDLWLGTSSLAIQFWELYCIVNEQGKMIVELWDGVDLRCTFRRCVDRRLMEMWEEVVSIVETLELSVAEDELIWQYNSSGAYSSKSLYDVINFRGVTPVFMSALWSLRVPPRIQFFLWLMLKNKMLTRDNL
jgi:hypothetical protein